MAQHDYNLANQSGADFRADLNNALSAIATVNSGASEPSTTFAHQLWVDTSNNVLKIRNAANSAFITTGVSITASNTFAGALTGNATTATTLETARTINGTSFNGSANISFNTDSVSEGSSNLYFTNERVDDQVNTLLQAGTGIQLTYDDTAGTLTIANTNDADITGVVAGNALTGGGTSGNVTLNVAVDDSSIEIDSDALRVKALGITNAMLAGSIANSKLANSGITINSQSLSLGGTLVLDTDNIGEGSSNLYYTDARANSAFDTRLATKDTGDLSEGSNLYYTDARARAAISENSAQLSYNSTTGVLTYTQGDTDTVSEGSSNLYYTQARFDTAFGNKTTADLTENTNLYYTDARANSAIDARVTNTFINNLSGVVADTSTALATARTIALSGDVVGSVSFDGTADVTIASTIQANSVALGTDTTGNYIQTITGTANKITVSGSGSESADVTLTLPDDVQIADSLTVAGNLTVNGTLVSLDTTNLDITDNLFQLNAGLTGSPVNDSGMLINRGNQNNGIFMWDESVDKFTMGLTTADGSATGNITLSSLGTLVVNIEGAVTGNVTGQVSDISNFTTANLTENTNLYYTQARFDSAFTAKSTSDLSEGSNLYYTDARFDTRLASKDTDDVSEGTSNLYYTSARFNSAFSGKSTSDLSEGTNLYYTDARVQAVSINNVVEDTTPQLGGDLASNGSDILFADNDKAIFGAGSDLQIYHDGSDSYIKDTGTGRLTLQSATDFLIANTANTQNYIYAQESGYVRLYYAGATKLATTSTGIDVTGTATMDGLTVDTTTLVVDASNNRVGINTTSPSSALETVGGDGITISNSGDTFLQLKTTGTTATNYIEFKDSGGSAGNISYNHTDNYLATKVNGSEIMRITSAGKIVAGRLSAYAGGKIQSFVNHTSGFGSPSFVAADSTDMAAGVGGEIGFYGKYSSADDYAFYGGIKGFKENGTDSNTACALSFHTRPNATAAQEVMRIDSAGNLLVGKTAADNTTVGIRMLGSSGFGSFVRDGNTPVVLNRLTSDGEILRFDKDSSAVGSIGASGGDILIGTGDTAVRFVDAEDCIVPFNTDGSGRDNAINLGKSSERFKDIYATNGTIQTSDRNEKQNIEDLTEAETRVAIAAKGLLKKFKFKSAVKEKGNEARYHFGIIAQDLQDAFTSEGLDAGDYGMFISNTWTDETTDEEKTRLGVRYSELLAFIISAI